MAATQDEGRMMGIELQTDETAMLSEAVQRFCEAEIAPHYSAWEKAGIFPRELWRKLGAAGFLCTDIPERYGSAGADIRCSAVINRELSRLGFTSIAVSVSVHSDIVAHYLVNKGSEAQREHYLPKMVSGECVGAIAMTEPAAGSDLQSIRTTATADGGDYLLNGAKTFITNGQHADLVITAAKTDPTVPGSRGTSLFLVDTNSPGFARGRNLDKIGLHSSDTSELFYDDVRVPAGALLGELNRGFVVLMEELPRERLALAMGAVGAMQGALEMTTEYVKERQAFGQPLAGFQNTRYRLADLYTEYRQCRAFVDECTVAFLEGRLDAATASMAKLGSTEAQCRIVDGCLQLFGGYGYMAEYPISRMYVDARIQRIYGGTSEVMRELVARQLLS
jgi:alkylation response protein AidB-like acyl-CoA dehydrogenase